MSNIKVKIIHSRFSDVVYRFIKRAMQCGVSENKAIKAAITIPIETLIPYGSPVDVSPKGGNTYVEIYDKRDWKIIGRGMARCSFADNYDKSTGRAIALYRALQSLFKDYGTSYDEELKQKLDTENLDEYLYFLQMKISFMGVK